MAQKLTKTQEQELERIRNRYDETLANLLVAYRDDLAKAHEFFMKNHLEQCLKLAEDGFILYRAWFGNSKTLEKLEALGYIEYKKQRRVGGGYPLDWVKLVK